jgi:hypothetical protein
VTTLVETTIGTRRLELVPLRAEDADELAAVLEGEPLHVLDGGASLSWAVRRSADAQLLGVVGAISVRRAGRWIVRVGLLVGAEWRGRGYASEAARALVDWLWRNGASDVVAHVHTRDVAAQVVAARAGLQPTDDRIGDEQIWRPAPPAPATRDGQSRMRWLSPNSCQR